MWLIARAALGAQVDEKHRFYHVPGFKHRAGAFNPGESRQLGFQTLRWLLHAPSELKENPLTNKKTMGARSCFCAN